jgi:hypothetical protein
LIWLEIRTDSDLSRNFLISLALLDIRAYTDSG